MLLMCKNRRIINVHGFSSHGYRDFTEILSNIRTSYRDRNSSTTRPLIKFSQKITIFHTYQSSKSYLHFTIGVALLCFLEFGYLRDEVFNWNFVSLVVADKDRYRESLKIEKSGCNSEGNTYTPLSFQDYYTLLGSISLTRFGIESQSSVLSVSS